MKPIDDSLQFLLFSSHSQGFLSLVEYLVSCISWSMSPFFHNVQPPSKHPIPLSRWEVIVLILLRFKFAKSSGSQNVALRVQH